MTKFTHTLSRRPKKMIRLDLVHGILRYLSEYRKNIANHVDAFVIKGIYTDSLRVFLPWPTPKLKDEWRIVSYSFQDVSLVDNIHWHKTC